MQSQSINPIRLAPARPCLHCGASFRPPISNVRRGFGRYCSRPCGYKSRPAESRFWAKIDKSGECWLWTGGLRGHGPHGGYGAFTPEPGRMVPAHRYAWELIHGPIPDGMFLLHNCPGGDNRACCRPAHMFLGDHAANMRDMVEKGRSLKGSKNAAAKLTEEQAQAIRARYANREASQYALAAEYGVSQSLVSLIIRGLNWTHTG